MSRQLTHIHPFPARMAPEIVFSRISNLPKDAVVLDPMAGSGTVLRAAAERGHRCIGFDLDPLAVLMSRVWTTPLDVDRLGALAERLVDEARHLRAAQPSWIAACAETREFVNYWFEPRQKASLRRLALALEGRTGIYADALRLCLSRTIITKERGASVARDTSHSRPHREFFDNDYDVFAGFIQSANRLGARLNADRLAGSAAVHRGDARNLNRVEDESVDAVLTSPPYLNAIDYMRGHRLALVWLGYNLSSLRDVRGRSIGTEVSRHPSVESIDELTQGAGALHRLPDREIGMVRRYALDIEAMLTEVARTLKPGGKVVLVVGNSCLKGVPISNAQINVAAARRVGLRHRHTTERRLPTGSRYLPIPAKRKGRALSMRMRTETVLSFTK